MEKIEAGKFVEMTYDLYKIAADGTETLVHQVDPQQPESVVVGVTRGMVEPLEKALYGLAVGDSFDVVATADEAFGKRDDQYVVSLEKEVFAVEGKFDSELVKVGEALPMMTADGFPITGIVLEVNENDVKMDFNHPLAGSSVRFKGKVVTVREATAEELKPQSCGCGCDHDHCGDSCGDDCSCGGCH